MGTPFADRIRAKAQEAANKPMTPTGAVGAMAKQAAVSSTGKAAAPGTGLAQSAVQETAVAEQATAQQTAIAEEVQAAGEDMAVTEKQADAKQSGVDSQQRQQKLEADNHFNNTLKKLSSRVEMADTKQEKELASLELKGTLQRQRLANAEYKQALQATGKRQRLVSREDFSNAMSAKALGRGKETGEADRTRKKMIEDYKRDTGAQVSMDQIAEALKKSESDSQAQIAAQNTGLMADMAKTGVSMGVDAWGDSGDQTNDLKLKEEGSISEADYNKKHGAGAFKNDNLEYQQSKTKPAASKVPEPTNIA